MADDARLQIVIEAKVDKLIQRLDQANLGVAKFAKKAQVDLEQTDSKFNKLFGHANVGEALERTFSRARLGVIEEGGAKIGLFGSSLEALGAAGLVAAGGLFAVGEAFEKAKGAAEWAEGVQKAADRIGISTKSLQEFDFAATLSGVSIDAFRESLGAANATLGAFQSNVGDGKVKKAFLALGISKEEARGFDNISQALPEIAEKLSDLGSIAEKTKIVDALGLGALLPLLLKGKEGFSEVTAVMQKYGIGLSEDVIRKGAEAAEQFKIASAVLDDQFKRAFLDIAPAAGAFALAIADAARNVAKLIDDVRDALPAIQAIQAKLGGLGKFEFTPFGIGGKELGFYGGLIQKLADAAGRAGREQKLRTGIDGILSGGKVDLSGVDQGEPKATGHALALAPEGRPKRAKKGPADQTDSFDKSATDALDTANKALQSALAALTNDIDAKAEFERKGVDADLDKKLKDLSEQEKKIRESKNDAHAKDQIALLEQAKADEQATADAKKEKITRDAQLAQADKDLAQSQRINGVYDEIAQIAIGLASTAKERLALELALLAQRKRESDAVLENEHQHALALANTPGQRDAVNSDFRARQGSANDLYAAQVREARKRDASPGDQYVDEIKSNLANASDQVKADGLKEFNSQLSDAIANSKSLGQALGSVFASIKRDLLNLAVEKYLTLPIAQALGFAGSQGGADLPGVAAILNAPNFAAALPVFGFASGTDAAPGGLTRYNEQGTEGYVPPGAQIIPNAVLRNIAALGASAARAPAGQVVSFDLRGAVMTDDLLAQMNALARQSGAQAMALSRQDTAATLRRQQVAASRRLGG